MTLSAGNLRLEGRVDRIDHLADGGLAVAGHTVGSLEGHHARAGGGEAVGGGAEDDAGHRPSGACQQLARRGVAALGQPVGVDHEEGRRARRAFLGRGAGAEGARLVLDRAGAQFPQHGVDVGARRAQQAAPRRLVEAAGVGQPFGPVPVVGSCALGQHGDADVGRPVVGCGLAHQAPEEGQGRGTLADHAEAAPGGQVDDDGRLLEHAVLGHEGVDLGRAIGIRPLGDRRHPRDVGDADPQLEEVVVRGPALPQAVAGAFGPAANLGRIGMQGVQPAALGRPGRAQGLGGVGQARPVLLAACLALTLDPPPVLDPVAEHHHRAEEGEERHARVPHDGEDDPHGDRREQGRPSEAVGGAHLAGRAGEADRRRRRRRKTARRAVEGGQPLRAGPADDGAVVG